MTICRECAGELVFDAGLELRCTKAEDWAEIDREDGRRTRAAVRRPVSSDDDDGEGAVDETARDRAPK